MTKDQILTPGVLPKTCSDCPFMGYYGHGETPVCLHSSRNDVTWPFANPRSDPPSWCPLRSDDQIDWTLQTR